MKKLEEEKNTLKNSSPSFEKSCAKHRKEKARAITEWVSSESSRKKLFLF